MIDKNKIIRTAFILAAVFIVVFISRLWQGRQVLQYIKTGSFFGSYVKVDVCYTKDQEDDLEKAMAEVWKRFADIHSRMSIYDLKSDILKINQAYDKPVKVGADTYQLIKDSIQYHRISNGAFDITVGPLIQLWKEKGQAHVMPTKEEIRRAQKNSGIEAIKLLNGHRILLKKNGAKINIDSIGDGYAADEAAKILRRYGFRHFLIDASGELFGCGVNCRGESWRIGIQDPMDPLKMTDIVSVRNLAVSTSGNYERYYEINGERWPHIINPRTGYPQREVLSATVIAPTAQSADFLSTALCVLNPRHGQRLIDRLGDRYASLVIVQSPQGRIRKIYSRRYPSYRADR